MKKKSGSTKAAVKAKVPAGGKSKLKSILSDDFPVEVLLPEEGVEGYVQFNGGEQITVSGSAGPVEVVPPVPIPAMGAGTPVQFYTNAEGGASRTVYLYYIASGSSRVYYESPNIYYDPREAIATEGEGSTFLKLELVNKTIGGQPTIVIGTVIIDLPEG